MAVMAMSEWNGTVAFTLMMNGYTESSVVDVDLADLSDNELRVIANLTEFSEDRLRELRDPDKVPCRSCGRPITDDPRDPPVCQRCLRDEGEGDD